MDPDIFTVRTATLHLLTERRSSLLLLCDKKACGIFRLGLGTLDLFLICSATDFTPQLLHL